MTACSKCKLEADLLNCAHCAKAVCEQCSIMVEGEPFCVPCWFGFIDTIQPPQPVEEPVERIPWQSWKDKGILTAFLSTLRLLSTHPERLFRMIPSPGGFTTPVLFALLCIFLFWFPMKMFYLKVAMPYMIEAVDAAQEQSGNETPFYTIPPEVRKQYEVVAQQPWAVFLLMPVHFLTVYVVFASLVQQMLILLFQGRHNYLATLQIRCYAMGALCLQLIPFVGIVLSEVMVLVLCTRGFQTVQRLPRWRAFLVALVPVLLSIALAV